MHENPGKDKIGKTLIINPGYAYDGRYAIIDLKGKKIKSIKFYK
jgi:Icc-related predicted phosphoesterase